jgi:hypothetical protein
MTPAVSSPVPGLLPREDLSAGQRGEMFELLLRHFEGVTRSQFERDLGEKNWVIEIRRDERLVGFTTLLVEKAEFDGEAITAIYSGDTIMAPEAWRSTALSRTWIAAVNHLRADFPARRCFWLLLTSGFRTYRFLPVFWRDFHPRFDESTPPASQRLLEKLARERYGTAFDAQTGLVHFPQPQKLRGKLGAFSPGREADEHVAYFLVRNPRHADGDELVCLTEISELNLTSAGRRMLSR